MYLWKNFVVKFLKLSMSTHEDNLHLTIEGLLHFLENNFVKPIMQVKYLNTKRWVYIIELITRIWHYGISSHCERWLQVNNQGFKLPKLLTTIKDFIRGVCPPKSLSINLYVPAIIRSTWYLWWTTQTLEVYKSNDMAMNFFYSMKKFWSILNYLNEAGTSIGFVMIFFSTYSGWNDFPPSLI